MPTNPTAEIIGYTGGVFLAICCIPQFIKMYKNKSAKDVSLLYTILYTTGLSLTLVYMVLLEATAAIVTISFEILIAFAVVGLKIYFDVLCGEESSLNEKEESVTMVAGDEFGTSIC